MAVSDKAIKATDNKINAVQFGGESIFDLVDSRLFVVIIATHLPVHDNWGLLNKRTNVIPNPPLLPPFAKAIEIAATQTKSACADWVIKTDVICQLSCQKLTNDK
ncbi:hypothetical protein [Coleofasciculus sp. G2-EDA-02]|uniref:hypothetical protein n=1 Tax=Coleofasciculus sp. G2-EDA-02 TaxID=3069529 RepID=UPI0032FB300F